MKDSILDTVSIIILAGVFVLNIVFRNQFDGGFFLFIISILLVLFGATVWLVGKKTLGNFFTVSRHPRGLMTKGIYSKIRHPMYYGGILVYVGAALFFKSWLGLGLTLFLVIPILFWFIKKEEGLLYEKFGKEYPLYKKKTII